MGAKLMYVPFLIFAEDMASLDSHDMTSLSDNIDSTDDLVPSLQVSCLFYFYNV
jgi:hypothetical protein